MSSERRPAGSGGGSFRLNYPKHLTEGGREELRQVTRGRYNEVIAELARVGAEQQKAGSATPELNAQSVRDAESAVRARAAPTHATTRSRLRELGHPSLTTGSAILVTVSSVATPAITPYLHSPWQWALFALSAVTGAIGLGGQWLTRSSRVGS